MPVFKERLFWSKLDDVIEGVPRGEKDLKEADEHLGEENRDDQEVQCRYIVKENRAEGKPTEKSGIL